MSVARHWYYARQIDELAARAVGDGPLDVLEIGGGAGNLALFLARMGRVRSYTIVDLPEMLVHSAYTIQRYEEQAGLSFDPGARPEVEADRRDYTFVPADQAPRLADRAFDLCLNLNSFMEMDADVRDRYIELIYRGARPGALFYNVNRRQPALPLRDGSTWDNNPLLYPYRSDDDVLVWEEDPFQTVTRTRWGARRTLTVTRAATVRAA